MKKCSITLSANAGFSMNIGGTCIWIDVLHRHKTCSFSTVTPELWKIIKENRHFANPDIIFFTHRHPDHYSRTLTAEALSVWENTKLILPEREFQNQITLTGDSITYYHKKLRFQFLKFPHEEIQLPTGPHYGVIISHDNFNVLVTGDCALCSNSLKSAIKNVKIDLAIMGFPWLIMPRGRAYISDLIKPKHLAVLHIPFEEDDVCGYRNATLLSKKYLKDTVDVRILFEAMQTETFYY